MSEVQTDAKAPLAELRFPEEPFERMADFIEWEDRSSPPAGVFAGREDELNSLLGAAKTLAKPMPGEKSKGKTVVCEGVAGVGKTALWCEFSRRRNWTEIEGKTIICAPIDPADLASDALDLCFGICQGAQALATGGHFNDFIQKHGDGAISVLLSVKTQQSKRDIDASRLGLKQGDTHRACFNAFARTSAWPRDAVIMLMLDEAQNLDKLTEGRDNIVKALHALHTANHEANIMLACFGLQNTAEVLAGFGLSRKGLKKEMEIGTLKPGEGREVLERSMDFIGLHWPDWRAHLEAANRDMASWSAFREQLIDALDAECSDFPQHLTAAAISACEALRMHRGNLSVDNDKTIINDARHMLREYKETFYSDRFSSDLEDHRTALAAIAMAASEKGKLRADLAEESLMAAANARIQGRLDIEGAKKALASAVDRGILRKGKGGAILPPSIPSMTSSLSSFFWEICAEDEPDALTLARNFGFQGASGAGDRDS